MKQVRSLIAARLVRIVGGIMAIILLNSAHTTSHAVAAETQPVLIWGRIYRYYYKFYQMQHVGGGEVVALASSIYNAAEIRLLKFSASGDIVWERKFGGGVRDYAKSLTRTTDGGFLICGNAMLNDGSNRYKIYLVKTDAEGNLQWQKTYCEPGNVYEYGWFAWQREDGGFGIFGGVPAEAPNDLYVAVTDTSGTLLNEIRFSGSAPLNDVPLEERSDCANGKPTQDGGCIIHTKTDLIKLTPQGNVEWIKDFRPLGRNPEIRDVAQTPDLGFAFVVYRPPAAFPELPDAYLKKLDPAGKETWSVKISDVGPDYFEPNTVLASSDGGLVVGGTDFQGSGGKRTVLKTNAAGTMKWSLFIPATSDDGHIDIQSIVEQGPDQYVVAGCGAANWQPDLAKPKAYLARIEVLPRSGARLSTMYQ